MEDGRDHLHTLSGGEGVPELVAPLRASDDQYKPVGAIEAVFDGTQMAQVEWLKPADEKCYFQWWPRDGYRLPILKSNLHEC